MGTVYYVSDKARRERLMLGKHHSTSPWFELPLTVERVMAAMPYASRRVVTAWMLGRDLAGLTIEDDCSGGASWDVEPDDDWTETDAWLADDDIASGEPLV